MKKERATRDSDSVAGEFVTLFGEAFYVIREYDRLPPFLMSVVSGSDHWMFLSTTGGVTAGRKNADSALFPYFTEDKVADNAENTGAKTILRGASQGKPWSWEPFSIRDDGRYAVTRNLYKNVAGTRVYFEEINHDLMLSFRYGWMSGDAFGIVKHSQVINLQGGERDLTILDGIQNILPYGVASDTQNAVSCLVDGYKKNEREPDSPLAIYRLSSLVSDSAKPSEALRCTTVWTTQRDYAEILLCSEQLNAFRRGDEIASETDVRAKRGAYFLRTDKRVSDSADWYIVAELNQDHEAVFTLHDEIGNSAGLETAIRDDIERGTRNLERIVGAADGRQCTRSAMVSAHHFANVLFNVMRGGTYANGTQLQAADFHAFCSERNRPVAERHASALSGLPETMSYPELKAWVLEHDDRDLTRLFYEYLPLFFSRRHGDPSRPWNRFSIDVYDEHGRGKLNYEGNWRDIFQNWEALSLSYPAYLPNIVVKFLNATTADGYNPYRITRAGIDWEVPELDNPWSNIGYWSDHQIVYLLRLLEWLKRFDPKELAGLMDGAFFTHADVPYRIKPYRQILVDSRDTIDFDLERHTRAEERLSRTGADGRLVADRSGELVYVSMAEKLLVLLSAKLVNFVPEGGIWMNTQRPEWNDANNALAGPGLSIVTLGHLRRYIRFLQILLAEKACASYSVSSELAALVLDLSRTLAEYDPASGFDPHRRRAMMDELGVAGEAYRESVYAGLSGGATELSADAIQTFLGNALVQVDATLAASKRADGLYHSYNLLVQQRDGGIGVRHLYEMLEGQVSIISSGVLGAQEVNELLESLYASAMYRPDQDSFMLYPDRRLERFVEKNTFRPDDVADSGLVTEMLRNKDTRVVYPDRRGGLHFNGSLVNAEALAGRLDEVEQDPRYGDLVRIDRDRLLELYEKVFDHTAFTGRSGTFFAYEGLGSIYWHQVAKLLLAVQDHYFETIESEHDADVRESLRAIYYRIRHGLGGSCKSPGRYGAFPMDPYSHTPKGKGAQQPGMTGQVKEEVITRFGEFGITIVDGEIVISPSLLKRDEFLDREDSFAPLDECGKARPLALGAGMLAFTYCGVPFVFSLAEEPNIVVHFADDAREELPSNRIPAWISRHLFARDGCVSLVKVSVDPGELYNES
ncbi:MAG: hypothetical protein EA419_04295 [Wenzhouxiangella sp.]|nr:MAG: hypothetical protein EA419_04295 [Wenzhouxiangella sp.]